MKPLSPIEVKAFQTPDGELFLEHHEAQEHIGQNEVLFALIDILDEYEATGGCLLDKVALARWVKLKRGTKYWLSSRVPAKPEE